jgi:uncharacterized cupredoxin-like copper-binding protein
MRKRLWILIGVAAGMTFAVSNQGALAHEFVIARSDLPAGKQPLKGGKANVRALRKIAGVGPSQTRQLAVKLAKGKYVLLCNLLGHYKAGQFAAFRVG